jgi:hypothetical protein
MKSVYKQLVVGLATIGAIAGSTAALGPAVSAGAAPAARPASLLGGTGATGGTGGTGGTVTFDSVVHLAGNLSASTTTGTFAVAGARTDSGTESGSGYFSGGATTTGPNVLHATQTFTGAHGTVTLSLVGDFGPLPAQTAEGTGTWRVTSGTGAYAHEHAVGRWNAVADFTAAMAHTGPPTVTFVLAGVSN